MANKRNFKKNIAYICSDIVGECIFAQQTYEGIDVEKMDDVIVKIALLQDLSIKNLSVDFDKKPNDYKANKSEYRKARKAYFKAVEKAIVKEFREGIESIVKEMNALLPAAQKEANKQMAK